VLQLNTVGARLKRVLLIDVVVWSPNYPATHPLRNVFQWYSRWLDDLPNVTLTPISAEADPLSAVRAGVDGVIISGSPRDAWNGDPINLRLCEVITACQERVTPVLGVCYGHQILGRALGAEVGRHPRGLELGNTEVELTPAGQASPLFAGFPARFKVLSSHADAVLAMPPQCELLVRGDFTPVQGFHWHNQLFGVQFHPETDPEVLRFLWQPRRETWRSKVSFDLDRVLDDMQPTPHAANLLRNFVTTVIP
jgi:GMP synthase (glutamine-hydrolysing)